MKITLSSLIGILLSLCFGCQNQPSPYSEKLEKALAGLTQLPLTDREENALMCQITDSAHLAFPIYSLEGELLTQAQIREKQLNVTVDCYSDSITNVKALVFRDLTQFDYQIVAEAQHIFDQYGIKPCPTNIVIDKSGQIVFAESGYYPQENGTQKKLKEAMEASLAK